MKRKQNIEQFFRDQQSKLDERPSPRAWDRLEKRLDQHQVAPSRASRPGRSRRLKPRFGLVRIAASLLLLVGMLTAISILFRPMSENAAPTASALPTPVMEVLQPQEEGQGGVYAIAVNFQRYLNQSPRNLYFAEGTESKKLRTPTNPPSEERNNRLAVISRNEAAKERTEEQPITSKDENTSSNSRASTASSVAKRKQSAPKLETIAEMPLSPDMARGTSSEPEALEEFEAPESYATDVIAYDDVPSSFAMADEGVAIEEVEEPEPETESLTFSNNSPNPYNSDVTQLNAFRNSLEYNGLGPNIDQFQWLIGQWSEKLGTQRETVEEWRQVDAFTIEGKGKLVVNGDTTFTEGMRIQKIEENLYFILALDEQNREVKFRLKSYDSSIAIFETEQPEVMNQVILRQSDFNNFSTTIQNAAPSMEQAQDFQYLKQRNSVEPARQRSSRNLSRVRE